MFSSRINKAVYLPGFFFGICCILIFTIAATLPAQVKVKTESVDIELFKKHMLFLGSDSLQGRGVGSPGEKLAADYICRQLQVLGIKPLGANNSFFQYIPMHGSRVLSASHLQLHCADQSYLLELNQDYLLFKTGAQTFVPQPLQMVFVGYGISAPEYDYDDYKNIEVQDKIVVYMAGEPYTDDDYFFNGLKSTIYSTPEVKQRIALSHGARGSIMIPNDLAEHDKEWEDLVRDYSFEDVTLAYTPVAHLSIIINPSTADLLFRNNPVSLQKVYELEQAGTMQSFNLGTKLEFSGQFVERDFLSQNVIGIFEGKKNSRHPAYVLVSAHYDHLGIGPPVQGDSIYNGVFDNAAGVAALLELVRMFSFAKISLENSLIFLFVSGEEKGLLGSTYYIDHPLVPLYRTYAGINIDGISLFDEFTNVVAPGIEFSDLTEDLQAVLKANRLELTSLPQEYFPEYESITRSDHYSFAKAGIPFAFILEGLAYKSTRTADGIQRTIDWIRTIYHTPADDLNQPINYQAAEQHIRLLFDFVHRLCMKTKGPLWKPASPFISARLRSIAEKR